MVQHVIYEGLIIHLYIYTIEIRVYEFIEYILRGIITVIKFKINYICLTIWMYEIVDLNCKHEWNSKFLGYSLYFRFLSFLLSFLKINAIKL